MLKKYFLLVSALVLSSHLVMGVSVLVPAYANPGSGDGPDLWAKLAVAGAANNPAVTLILNPASGPGASAQIDPNYINTGGTTGALLDATGAGATAIGYIATTFGGKSFVDVQSEIDLYVSDAYWRGAGIQISGFFLDEVTSDLSQVGYYQQIQSYVYGLGLGFEITGNPGVSGNFDTSGGTSGFTVDDYISAFDTLVTFENTGTEYRTNYTAPVWQNDANAPRMAHIVHSETNEADMLTSIALAGARGADFVYVTDDLFTPNPFDNTPTYWDRELAAIRAIPEPSAVVLLFLGSFFFMFRRKIAVS